MITIGDNNQLTNCKIFTHGGANCVRNRHPKFDCFGKVTIGDWCYIGSNSLIMHGVSIGNNVLVAAGSVVTKSIPSNMVVAGNSAKIICTVEEYFNRNKDFDLETKGLNAKDKKKILSGGGGGDVNLLKNRPDVVFFKYTDHIIVVCVN